MIIYFHHLEPYSEEKAECIPKRIMGWSVKIPRKKKKFSFKRSKNTLVLKPRTCLAISLCRSNTDVGYSSPASWQPSDTQVSVQFGNSWELFVPWETSDHCWVTTFGGLSCTMNIYELCQSPSSCTNKQSCTHGWPALMSTQIWRGKAIFRNDWTMPWWATWQKELFYLISQQHKLCWISSATRPEPHLHLLLLSFCCESHDGEDEKREGGKEAVTALGPCSGDHHWAWRTTGKELIFMASSLPGKQQWQEAHTPWHSQHPLHMSARHGASSCCLPGPHNLDRHRFCAGTGALSQSCLPRVTGCHSSPRTMQENTGAQECWCSAEWTVLPLHSSEKLHSRPEKGQGTQYMHRLQTVPACTRGLTCQMTIFNQNNFLHFRFTCLFPKELSSLKKILTFLSKCQCQGLATSSLGTPLLCLQWVWVGPSPCARSGNQVPQPD